MIGADDEMSSRHMEVGWSQGSGILRAVPTNECGKSERASFPAGHGGRFLRAEAQDLIKRKQLTDVTPSLSNYNKAVTPKAARCLLDITVG
jgi:hypothetical protein